VGDEIETNEMGGACSAYGRGIYIYIYTYRVSVGKPEGKRQLERPTCRWEDNIKEDLQEVGCGIWSGLSWLRIETVGRHL
jgi:hypothetical protein